MALMPSTPGMATNSTENAARRCTMGMESEVGEEAAEEGKCLRGG